MKNVATVLFSVFLGLFGGQAWGAGKNYDVQINEMHCEDCAKRVQAALAKLPDVEPGSVTVVLKENLARIKIKDGVAVPLGAIQAAVKRAGYVAGPIEISK